MKLNNKGFAVSTILYGLLSLIILILMIIFGVMRANKDMNEDLVESLTDSMNACVSYEVKLESCYLNGDNCEELLNRYNYCVENKGMDDSDNQSNRAYSVGDYVMLVDGTRGTVIKDSGASEELITILSETNYGSYPFDSTGSTVYDPTSPTNVGYVVKNTILPQIKSSIDSAGGDSAGTDARLVTYDEYQNARSLGTYIVQPATGDKKFQDAWMMTACDATGACSTGNVHTIWQVSWDEYNATSSRPVTPVIITKKSNIADFPTAILLSNNLQSDDDSGISFAVGTGATSAYGKKLGSENSTVSFTSSTTYYFSSTYSFDASTGTYSLAGTKTSGTWSSMSSNYTTYPYTCRSTSSTGTCITLDKMTSYTSATSGKSIAYIRTSISNLNGQGLYYTEQNKTDDSIYFRGAVKNNYVYFAGIIWRIVRINEDGSIRLITQDRVGTSAFNTNKNDNAYIGYMFGTAGSSTYALTHANNNNSTIKTYVDNWYVNTAKLTSYTDLMSTTAGFCNDRSIAPTAKTWYSTDTALGYGTNTTHYGNHNRYNNLYLPQNACPNEDNDLFTLSTSSKGNKKLTYPVGLLTADEAVYAGALYVPTWTYSNTYLNIDHDFWTMTPLSSGSSAEMQAVWSDSIASDTAHYSFGVRPVINLKPGVKLTGGSGTASDPYIITK